MAGITLLTLSSLGIFDEQEATEAAEVTRSSHTDARRQLTE